MAIIHSIFTNSFEEFQQVIFDQHGASEDAHNLKNRPSDFEVVLDDSHKTVSDDGHMNLYSDCVFRLTPELLDLQMLLNPLEEEFHLPAVALKQGDAFGRKLVSCMHNLSDFDSDHNIRISKVGHGFYCSKRYA